jgi:hypothetical protein
MSLWNRILVVVVEFWNRSSEHAAPAWCDVEGMGRLLARPRDVPLSGAGRAVASTPTPLPATKRASRARGPRLEIVSSSTR